MLLSIKELRVQRELVQKHLDWLDAQIEQIENPDPVGESTAKSDKSGSLLNHESEKVSRLNNKNTSNQLVPDTKTAAVAENDSTLLPEASGIKQVKLGCIIFFAIVTLLFLFLLFILPYIVS